MEETDSKEKTNPSNQTIQIYLRIRPTNKRFDHLTMDEEKNIVEFYVQKKDEGYVNNTKEHYKFKFEKAFGMKTKQDEIFNSIAKDVIDSGLDGYNGTIFAYGQTGSGKTYTITGAPERYEDRGIIPRTLQYIFQKTREKNTHNWKICVSYLEIYNNEGFDLLDENHNTKELSDLPKVILRENQNHQVMLSNLSVHHVANDEQALNLLFIGDTNRVVAETPKNDVSTRSHCIFIIQIESQKIGYDTKTISKLHIVDLSGSERTHKTGIEGKLMKEAQFINLSLHFLETVIVSLNQKAKNNDNSHIPYRNSMMTMVLRDSLGGNCKTRMIATMSPDPNDSFESISTCKFAMRVSLIKNDAIVNEIEDPILIIEKQKKEINDLKNELALVKGKDQKIGLEKEDFEFCRKIIRDYLADENPNSKISLKDLLLIQECFKQIKFLYKEMEKLVNEKKKEVMVSDSDPNYSRQTENKVRNDPELMNINNSLNNEIQKLREIIKQRDEEIKLLLSHIEKLKSGSSNDYYQKNKLSNIINEEDRIINDIKNNSLGNEMKFENNLLMKSSSISTKSVARVEETQNDSIRGIPADLVNQINSVKKFVTCEIKPSSEFFETDDEKSRLKAYEMFKKITVHLKDILELKKTIENNFKNGKMLAEEAKKIREEMTEIMEKIKQIKKEQIIQEISDESALKGLKEKEELLNKKLSTLKNDFNTKTNILNKLRNDNQNVESTLENLVRVKVQKEFDIWFEAMKKFYEFLKNNKSLTLDQSRISERNQEQTKFSDSINLNNSSINRNRIEETKNSEEIIRKNLEKAQENLKITRQLLK